MHVLLTWMCWKHSRSQIFYNYINKGMKKVLFLVAAGIVLAACEKSADNAAECKEVTFAMSGWETEVEPLSRASLEADGQALTDVWVLDYVGGELVQQLHQVSTDADFAEPKMTLAYGEHNIYFVASRGVDPVLSTTAHSLTFGKVRDTFWKAYNCTVTGSSVSNISVTLDRVVTRMRVNITDVVDANAATLLLKPSKWYLGLDYLSGEPTAESTDFVSSVTIPDSYKGQTGLQASIFGFSAATSWTTDVIIECRKSDNSVIGSANISDVPFARNRASVLSGNLFSHGGNVSVAIQTDWLDTYDMTW